MFVMAVKLGTASQVFYGFHALDGCRTAFLGYILRMAPGRIISMVFSRDLAPGSQLLSVVKFGFGLWSHVCYGDQVGNGFASLPWFHALDGFGSQMMDGRHLYYGLVARSHWGSIYSWLRIDFLGDISSVACGRTQAVGFSGILAPGRIYTMVFKS